MEEGFLHGLSVRISSFVLMDGSSRAVIESHKIKRLRGLGICIILRQTTLHPPEDDQWHPVENSCGGDCSREETIGTMKIPSHILIFGFYSGLTILAIDRMGEVTTRQWKLIVISISWYGSDVSLAHCWHPIRKMMIDICNAAKRALAVVM